MLTQGTVTYTGLGVEITLLNLEDRSKLGSAIQALSSVIGNSKLPIPTSPYTEGLSYVLQFANTAIDNDIKNHNQDDKFKSGALDFNFDPDGACNGDFEKTDTKAIVFSEGPQAKDDSYIDISKTGDYCWSADLTPSFVLKAVHMDGGKTGLRVWRTRSTFLCCSGPPLFGREAVAADAGNIRPKFHGQDFGNINDTNSIRRFWLLFLPTPNTPAHLDDF